jgi:hypothetical protein
MKRTACSVLDYRKSNMRSERAVLESAIKEVRLALEHVSVQGVQQVACSTFAS